MLKDITLGQYFPGNSVIHKLDPRMKIVITMLYIVTLFVVPNLKGYAFFFIYTLSIVLLSRIPVKFIFKGLKPLFFIISLTAVLNMFMTEGQPVISIGVLSVSAEGIRIAVFMVLRLIFLLAGSSMLTLTTSPIALTDGIELLLSRFKKVGFPAHELAMMMTIALRFIPTLLEETDRLMKAQIARGAKMDSGGIMSRAKALIPILIPLFISAFRRADQLATAMEARCYRGGENRTKMKQLKMDSKDYYALAISILVIAVVFSTGF